ncbi:MULTISPECIES: dicarboxylate/amino acid:cation symporter [unclassified Shewanella]|uniref:dicarboxylate/amino acid:cation symporter n=1 Tax=unclassified Shewanella TaxID=196818 RepID=UPI000C81C862|nr:MULTISPECIES: dicarboxylate/amino acid:cation symporter [unclassified Shewanella]MDO6619870.1 dicarboxylate/amino acid:cation symporter [Shewanella sp. 6_MG-2023]MDO6679078.1 dicarboxylate/amino acid:cation symporter [Shewanella sp. 4_MG-2023]MDO6776375.1 dicarboxylate/amino acid:cation symporter [Shewanella sp. 3_MG-2023]PMG27024.1 amino acid:proton symporter [Shewanella sp. 10N.286.52.C2]PMG44441.1 amino acid:proton symporter [Shewanella sp. 10N.286.52.B9]
MIFQTLKRIPFWQKVLAGFALGILAGVALGESAVILKPLGDLFISAIKMLVAPLVFCAIVVSITSLGSQANLKRLSFKTLGMFMFTGTMASFIGLAIGSSFDMGGSLELATSEVRDRDIPGFAQVLLNMIPVNPFASLAEGKVLQIIVFAALVGIAINAVGEKAEPLKRTIEAGSEVMFELTRMVLKLTPIGVFGLMAWVVGEYGLSTLLPLGKFIVAIYVAALIHIIFVYGGLVKFAAGLSPVQFFRKAMPAQLVAFSTASSFGTLPASSKCTESMGVSKRYSAFVLPLGATMNMDGCGGIYPAIAAIFIAQIYGIPLDMTDYMLIAVTATVASVGTAGVPGSAMVMLTVTLGVVGLPLEGIAFIAAIDRVIDMIRTATNVTGDMMTAVVVGKSEGQFDEQQFYSDEKALNQAA